MRSHFEGTQFEQSQAQPVTLWWIKLVDAELGSMRVSSDIDQQVAEQSVHNDRRAAARRQITKGDFWFIHRIHAGLVDARILARGAYIHAGKKIRQRGMV